MKETINAFYKKFKEEFRQLEYESYKNKGQTEMNDIVDSVLSLDALVSEYFYRTLSLFVNKHGKDILMKEETERTGGRVKSVFLNEDEEIGTEVDLRIIPEKYRGILVRKGRPEIAFTQNFKTMGIELLSREVILEKVAIIYDADAYGVGDYNENVIRFTVRNEHNQEEEFFFNDIGAGHGTLFIVEGQEARILNMMKSIPLWLEDIKAREEKEQRFKEKYDEEDFPF